MDFPRGTGMWTHNNVVPGQAGVASKFSILTCDTSRYLNKEKHIK